MWMCSWVHDARSGVRGHQERVGRLPEEHWFPFHRRTHLLPGRLRLHVRRGRGGRLVRDVQPLLPQFRRGERATRRRCVRRRRRHPDRPRVDVQLALPDGLRGLDGLHRVRDACRASEALVVLPIHRGADGGHLSDRRRVDLGRRLAGRDGLPGLCGVDDGSLDGRMGGPRRCARGRGASGQVPDRRYGQADPPPTAFRR